MKKCVDCLHFRKDKTCNYFIPGRPYGRILTTITTSCISRRLDERYCGETAKLFVSKEKVKSMIGE